MLPHQQLSFWCQQCGAHINDLTLPLAIRVGVHRALPDYERPHWDGVADILVQIAARPVPEQVYCVDCFTGLFGPALSLMPGDLLDDDPYTSPRDMRAYGSLMAYNCYRCECQINVAAHPTYVNLYIGYAGANVGTVTPDQLITYPQLIEDIISQRVAERNYCLLCFHVEFSDTLPMITGGS